MSSVIDAQIDLATAVVQTAAKLWLGDKKIAADPQQDVIGALLVRLPGTLQRRRLVRAFDRLVDVVTEKLSTVTNKDFGAIGEGSKFTVMQGVREDLEGSPLLDDDLFERDLDAAYFDQYVRRTSSGPSGLVGHSADTRRMYDAVLRDCCEYIVQVLLTLPSTESGALDEILRRESELAESLEQVLSRLPDRNDRDSNDFEVGYRRQVFNNLDRIELFGASLQEASRRYPLSVAYIGLSVAAETGGSVTETDGALTAQLRIHQLLSRRKRILLRGEAGGGKTTLLQWIAVRAALRDFPAKLPEWNGLVPFFIPLRRYVDSPMPTPDAFVAHMGRHIREEMPEGWVESILRRGQAVVLVDGVDELPEQQRAGARQWLEELVTAYPQSFYVVTSRPGAAAFDWLQNAEFQSYELQPMTQHDVREFIRHWHEAIRSSHPDAAEKVKIRQYEDLLAEKVRGHRHLRMLAETPLLCALICALHHDRRGQLPSNRLELYDVALDMLLERRDAERHLAAEVKLSRTDKVLLLQDISWWFILNGWSDATKEQVVWRIRDKLKYMPQVRSASDKVYRHLLERTGILREPLVGRVDFVHRTFQEYLAALGALANDDVQSLIENAHHDQWREVIVMAAGRAHGRERRELIEGILNRNVSKKTQRDQLTLLSVGCLENSPEISPTLRQQIQKRAEEVLPPKSFTAAKVIASAGDFAVDLLARTQPRLAREVAATIRAAAEIGVESSMGIIQRFSADTRATVVRELLLAWPRFDIDAYAIQVLQHNRLFSGYYAASDPTTIPALKYLAHLRHLLLDETLRVQSLHFLAELESLQTLWTSIPLDEDLSPLPHHLKVLHLHNATVPSLSTAPYLPNLLGLNITGHDGPIEWSRIGFAGTATSLAINFCNVRNLYDISNTFPDIKALSLSGCQIESLDGIQELTKLQVLDLLDARVIQPQALRHLTYLRVLDLSDTNDPGLQHIALELGLAEAHYMHPLNIRRSNFRYPGAGFIPSWFHSYADRRSVWARVSSI